jgi:hypothetical protein
VVNPVRICVKPQLGSISNMDFTEVVFINIAKHPHFGKIGDGKKVGAVVEALDPLKPGNVLLHDRSRDWGTQLDE